MIFGTVGMHTSGFDRLVRALDAYAAARPHLDVLIQYGSGTHAPAQARGFRYKDSLREEIEGAEAVVCQAGMTVLEPLRLGKRLVVVPRQPGLGEILNGHQVDFARVFSERYGFPVVLDIAELAATLDRVLAAPPPEPAPIGKPTGLHRELARYLGALAGTPDPGGPATP